MLSFEGDFRASPRSAEKSSEIAQRRWHPLVKNARERWGIDLTNDVETAHKILELERTNRPEAQELGHMLSAYLGQELEKKEEERDRENAP